MSSDYDLTKSNKQIRQNVKFYFAIYKLQRKCVDYMPGNCKQPTANELHYETIVSK